MKPTAFSDFLRYLWPDGTETIRLDPDGYLACIRFRGPDPLSSNPVDFDDYERQLAALLENKGSEWGYHISVGRMSDVKHPSTGAWPSTMVYALDFVRAERYESEGEHLPTEHFLWISYYPRSRRGRLIAELTGNADFVNRNAREHFESTVGDILAGTRMRMKEVQRLGARPVTIEGREVLVSDLIGSLYYHVTGEEQLFVIDPEEPMFVSPIVSPSSCRIDDLTINGRRVVVASLWGWPIGYATSAILTHFARLPFHVRLTSRIVPFTGNETQADLTNRSRTFMIASLGPGLLFNKSGEEEDATPMHFRASIKAAQDRNKEGTAYCSNLTTVIAYARTDEEYDAIARSLQDLGRNLSIRISVETGRQRFTAYLSSLPGEFFQNKLRRGTMRMAAAMKLAPLGSAWHGSATHPNKRYPNIEPVLMLTTPNNEPFRCYHHVGEVGHTLILGKTGFGKSVFMRALENGHLARYQGATVITADIGFSAYKYAKAIRGNHLTAELGRGPQFAILSGLADPSQREAITEAMVDLVEVWRPEPIDLQEYGAIEKGLESLATSEPEHHRLSMLGKVVQDDNLRAFFARFKDSFLDAATDPLDFTNAAVRYWAIEYGTLGIDNIRWIAPFISYLQRRAFASFAEQPKAPRLINIDEGARALRSRRIADLAERIDREGRKHLTSLLFATQSAQEVLDSPIAQVLIEQTATRIMARNPRVKEPKTREQYARIGFTDEQLNIIPQLGDFEVLIANEYGSQVAALRPTPLELAVYAGASEEDKQLVDACISKAGPRWFREYCEERPDLPDMSAYLNGIEALDALAHTDVTRTLTHIRHRASTHGLEVLSA